MKQRFGVFARCLSSQSFVPPETVSGQSDVDSGERSGALDPNLQLGEGFPGARLFRKAKPRLARFSKRLALNCDGLSLRARQDLFGSTMSKFRSDHLGFAAVTKKAGNSRRLLWSD